MSFSATVYIEYTYRFRFRWRLTECCVKLEQDGLSLTCGSQREWLLSTMSPEAPLSNTPTQRIERLITYARARHDVMRGSTDL